MLSIVSKNLSSLTTHPLLANDTMTCECEQVIDLRVNDDMRDVSIVLWPGTGELTLLWLL